MIQMTDLVHQMVVVNYTLLFVGIKEAIQVGKIAVKINTIVIGSSDQVIVSSLRVSVVMFS